MKCRKRTGGKLDGEPVSAAGKMGPVALAHIKQLILALENKHAITRTSYWPD